MSIWDDIGSFLGNVGGDISHAFSGNQATQAKPVPTVQQQPQAQFKTAPIPQINPAQQQAQHIQQINQQGAQAAASQPKKEGFLGNVVNDVASGARDVGGAVESSARAVSRPVAHAANTGLNAVSRIPAVGKPLAKIDRGIVSTAAAIPKAVGGIVNTSLQDALHGNNNKATQNATAARNKAETTIGGAVFRPLAQAAESVVHPLSQHTYTPTGTNNTRLLGTNPIQNINKGVNSTYQHGRSEGENPLVASLRAGAYGTGQVAQDVGTVAGLKTGLVGAKAAAGEQVKPVYAAGPGTEKVAGKGSAPNLNADMFSKENIAKYEKMNAEEKADLPPDEQMKLAQAEGKIPTAKEKLPLNHPLQTPANNLRFTSAEGNIKGAIGESDNIAERAKTNFNQALNTGDKLDDADKAKLSDYLNGEKVTGIKNPSLFEKTAKQLKNAYDYHLGAKRLAGSETGRFQQGNYSPLMMKASTARLDELGVPAEQRFDLGNGESLVSDGQKFDKNGDFGDNHDIERKYKSYSDAFKKSNGILVPANKNALVDAAQYAKMSDRELSTQLLKKNLQRVAPSEINDLGKGGKGFKAAANGELPFDASEKLNRSLNNYKSAKLSNPVAEMGLNAAEKVSNATRGVAFLGAPVHYFNTGRSFLDTVIPSGHGATAAGGIKDALTASLNRGSYTKLEEAASVPDKDGVSIRDFQDKMGMVEKDTRPNLIKHSEGLGKAVEKYSPFKIAQRNMNRWINTLQWKLVERVKESGVDPSSIAGQKIGKELSYVMDRINSKVEGLNPIAERLSSTGSIAPHWIRANLGLVYHAAKESIPGVGTAKTGFGLSNAGDIARTNVVGGRLLNASIAVIASAIASGKLPTFKQAIDEGGFNPNNPNPNIQANQAKPKGVQGAGESQVLNIPTDPLGMAGTFATDPVHALTARETPLLSGLTQVATGKNFNENYNYNVNAPKNVQDIQRAKAGLSNLLPYAAQEGGDKSLDTAQKLAELAGFRAKTNMNTPQMQGAVAYENAKSKALNAATPAARNVLNEYFSRSLTNTGQNISAGTVGGYLNAKLLTVVNPANQHALQLLYNSQHSLKNNDPLWSLPLNAPAGKPSVSAYLKVQSQYEGPEKDGAKTAAQGAVNSGWLTNLQNQRSTYYGKLGSSADAPASEPAYPSFDKPTTADMAAADKISNSTQYNQFLTSHPDVTDAYANIAQWTNNIRKLEGGPPLQATAQASPQLQQIMNTYNALPASKSAGNTNTATNKARSNWIKTNPTAYNQMATFYANSAMTSLLKNSIEAVYSGQNGNSQSVLKDAKNVGQDIVQGSNGQYSINPAAAYAAGSSSSSSSSGAPSLKLDIGLKASKLYVPNVRKLRTTQARDYFKTGKSYMKLPTKNSPTSSIAISGIQNVGK